jgi:hypothetical protein
MEGLLVFFLEVPENRLEFYRVCQTILDFNIKTYFLKSGGYKKELICSRFTDDDSFSCSSIVLDAKVGPVLA